MDQILEARVRAQWVECGLAFEERQPEIALLIALFKPREGLILVAETNVDFREVRRSYVAFLRLLPQIRNHFPGVRHTPHSSVNVAGRRVRFRREISRLLQFIQGILKLAQLDERLAEVQIRGLEARLEIQDLAQLRDCFVVSPRLV